MKEKRSFFERLTGTQKMNNNEPMNQGYYDYSPPIQGGGHQINPQGIQDDYSFQPSSPPTAHQPSVQEQPQPAEEETWSQEGEGQLTIDVYQTDTDIVIKSTIAGVKPEDLDVAINNDMVTIRGERKNEERVESENYYYQECYWGTFSRSVILPVEVIADKSEAAMKNGILTIRLPKADTTKTKRIQVRGF